MKKFWKQAVLDFVDYKYDVLVATTIIENGIDIPRANTIIINRADNYGFRNFINLAVESDVQAVVLMHIF